MVHFLGRRWQSWIGGAGVHVAWDKNIEHHQKVLMPLIGRRAEAQLNAT